MKVLPSERLARHKSRDLIPLRAFLGATRPSRQLGRRHDVTPGGISVLRGFIKHAEVAGSAHGIADSVRATRGRVTVLAPAAALPTNVDSGLAAPIQTAVLAAYDHHEHASTTAVADPAVETAANDLQQEAEADGEHAAVVVEAVQQAAERLAASSEAEETEVVELVIEEPQQRSLQERAAAFAAGPGGRGLLVGAAVFLTATFTVALHRTWQAHNSAQAQRRRTIDRNRFLVDELSKWLPQSRGQLTSSVLKRIKGATGFSGVEVFRKYLWFLLRERQLDADTVADMVALKEALGLSDEEVAEALCERSQRIYDKYGSLMLNTEGMTPGGIERKATCRSLFSKLVYLTEHEPLLAGQAGTDAQAELRKIFGALDEDVDKLRIVSLYELDTDSLERRVADASGLEGGQGSGGPGAGAGSGRAPGSTPGTSSQ